MKKPLLRQKSKRAEGKEKGIEPVISRLNKIEGQITGIKKLYSKDPCDCKALINQVQASRAALASTARLILKDEAQRCSEKGDIERLEEIIKVTYKVI